VETGTAPTANGTDGTTEEEPTTIDPGINASAGIERMENDIKTGGLQRKACLAHSCWAS